MTAKTRLFVASEISPLEPLLPEKAQKPSFGSKARPYGRQTISGGTRVTDTFDFVVVGGGSGGCAVAGRLSEDPKTSVALLDAGGKNDNWVVTTPFAMVLMVSGKINNWAFDTVPQKGLNGRIGYQPRGKGLGGSSAINAMVYIRGHRSRLRPMGRARQSRLVVCRRAALLQALGRQCRFRRRVSRQGRPARGQQAAHRQSRAGDFSAGRARGASSASATISMATSMKASASTR